MFQKINDDGTVILQKIGFDYFKNNGKVLSFDELAKRSGSYKFVAYVDVETTGVEVEFRDLIELSIVLTAYESNKFLGIVDYYTGLNKPEAPLDEKIIKFTGLTDKDLVGQSIDSVRIKDILDKASLVIAHNAKFDRSFFKKYGLDSPNKIWLCSLNMIDWLIDYGFPSGKLELLEHYHNFYVDAHRSFSDTLGLIYLLNECNSGLYFEKLISVLNKSYFRIKVKCPYDLKWKIKDQGYRFCWETKSWDIITEDFESELRWIQQEIFEGNELTNNVVALASVTHAELI